MRWVEKNKKQDLDPNFEGSIQEGKAIKGTEQCTAGCNGEVASGQVTRNNDQGMYVITEGVTSNKAVKRSITRALTKRIQKRFPSYNPDPKKYKNARN